MTEKTETTRRAMYFQLERIRRAAKHRKLTLAFEESLEAHLEALREQSSETFGERMLEERNALQGRMHALDEAYRKSQEALGVAGEQIRYQEAKIKSLDGHIDKIEARVDELSKQNRDFDAVVRNQRQAYAELFMENPCMIGATGKQVDPVEVKMQFSQPKCPRGWGHGGSWCGSSWDCWLDPRPKSERP